ncbi:MAG: hypothetical protein P4L66_16005 [Acetobacteraceae bacterium]|nr:hypothetical protein [Acetobacteraceae bacterium]
MSVLAACYGLKSGSGRTRTVSAGFFEGPGLTNSGAVSTVLSLIPLLLSADVRSEPKSVSLLGAATLVFALSTFLGLWLYGGVAAAPHATEGGVIKVTIPRRLIVVQNVIMSCLIVGAGCFLVFLLVTHSLVPPDAKSNSKVTILECTDDNCRRR